MVVPSIYSKDESRTRNPAVFRGITGMVQFDSLDRLVFLPDVSGMKSQPYKETVAEVGGEWDEWTFELDVEMCQDGEVLVITVL